MTYGPKLQWRIPFQEKLELKKPDLRVVFISLCIIVTLIVLISFSYYTSVTVTLSSNQFQTHSTDVGRFTTLNVSRPTDIQIEEDDYTEISEVTTKEIEEVFSQLHLSAVLSNDNETTTSNLEAESESLEADENGNATLGTRLAKGVDWNDTRLDILHMPKFQFDTRFKNPCWYEPLQDAHPYESNSYIPFSPAAKRVLAKMTDRWENEFSVAEEKPSRLRCLPYFLIIGQPKCGTTDLFWKIAKHPDIEAPPIKELHWWSRSRQGRRFSYSKIIPFSDYVDMFDQASVNIEQRLHNITAITVDGSKDSNIVSDTDVDITQKITGEASVSLFWDNNEWMRFPENRGHTEPVYIVPHYIHHIIPDAKLIIMLRDPIERMYSDYLYFHSTNKSADDFHSSVQAAISLYSNCTAKNSVRQCIYDTTLANKVRVRLRIGMYSVYLRDWLSLFPLQQFYILRLEDYSRDPVQHVKQIYDFLNMRDITKQEEEFVSTSPGRNARKPQDQLLGGMHEKTRQLLHDFYMPYNQELAQMLRNRKYLWTDS